MKEIDKQIKEIEEKMSDPDLCFGTASTWSRCTGYYRAVENWNYGKRREYADRTEYQPFEAGHNGDKQWVEKLLHGKDGAK
ncbi:MAG: anaerobic ribonucleoside-triphosphate reductase [Endomicrobium sp.]|jgi:hypothetical protein|nr:anaerobic ribonucleoside-triphosphate reductase [Endomicrobium sp.]